MRLIVGSVLLLTAMPALSEDYHPPVWEVTPDTTDSSCTLVGTRHVDGETSIDMFYWQVRDLVSVQAGFGLTREEAQELEGARDGSTLKVGVRAVPKTKKGMPQERDLGTTMFAVHKDRDSTYISAVLPIDILTDLEKDEFIDLFLEEVPFRHVDLTGSAAAAAQMGPCMAGIARHLEGRE